MFSLDYLNITRIYIQTDNPIFLLEPVFKTALQLATLVMNM